MSYEEIVDKTSGIKAGSADFTRKFIDIARAGNKMITADQTMQNLFNNDRRSELQTLASRRLLKALEKNQLSGENDDNDDDMSQHSSMTEASNGMGGMEDTLEAQLILKKNISYQSVQVPYIKRARMRKSRNASSAILQDSIESELSSEVVEAVEEREEAVEDLKHVVKEMENRYFAEGLEAAGALLEHFEEAMQQIRLHTIDFSDAYGAWARVSSKIGRTEKEPRGRDRPHSVVIAFHGAHDLYPASEAVHSNVKKFSRGLEGAARSVELKYVGVFDSREDAVQAFDKALAEVPEEHWLLADKNAISKSLIALRPCKKHFLVRSSGVPADLKCEQCEGKKTVENANMTAKLYNNPFPPFIYKESNYLEKVWTDLAFLQDFECIRKLYPDFHFDRNPLLLDSSSSEQLVNSLRKSSTKNKKQNNVDPLSDLKGKREQLHDALVFSKSYREKKLEELKLSKFANHPWHPDHAISHLSKSLQQTLKEKPNSTKRSKSSGLKLSASTSFLPDILEYSDQLRSSSAGNIGTWSIDLGGITQDRLQRALSILGQTNQAPKKTDKLLPLNVEKDKSLLSQQFHTTSYEAGHDHHSSNAHAPPLHGHTNMKETSKSTAGAKDKSLENTLDVEAVKRARHKKYVHDNVETRPKAAVETFLSETGAQMQLVKDRFMPAYRTDEIFCRTDVGEWAGLSKGRAMRAFEFQEDLVKKGKEKEEFRKRIQQELRKAVNINIVYCDVDAINELINIAKSVRSSVLGLDVIQAENYLHRFAGVCKYSLRIQSIFRGNQDRKIVHQIKSEIRKKKKHRITTEKESYKMAQIIMPELVDRVYQSRFKKKLKPKFSCVANLSGFLCVITIWQAARPFRKPVNTLCPSCKTLVAESRLNRLDNTIANQRTPCTCENINGSEEWLVRFYFPLQCEVISCKFATNQVRDIIHFIEKGRKLLEPEVVKAKIVGDSFGDLEPLFPMYQNLKIPAHLLVSKSYTKSWFQAARESAVLPRLPPILPSNVMSIMDDRNGNPHTSSLYFEASISKTIAQYHSSVVRDEDDTNQSDRILWTWQPFDNLERKENALKELEVLLVSSSSTRDEVLASLKKEETRELYQRELKEQACMRFEENLSKLADVFDLLNNVERRNKEIMDFSKALFEETSALEMKQKIDDSRSYDLFENASAWKDLYKKKKLEKIFNSEIELMDTVQRNKANSIVLHNESVHALDIVCKDFTSRCRRIEEIQLRIESLRDIIRREKDDLHLTIKTFACIFSYPKKLVPVCKRSLQIVPFDLVFVREPMQRLKMEYRKSLTGLYRQVKLITSSFNSISTNNRTFQRCLVSVFADSVTGNMIINLDHIVGPVEECAQHEDQCVDMDTFTDFIKYAQPNDIVLRPIDVELVLRHEPDYTKTTIRPKARLDHDKFHPPSKFARSLEQYKVFANRCKQLQGKHGNYVQQTIRREKQDEDKAEELVKHLRMQPYTGRPCLGLLHFYRRREFTMKNLIECMWYSDRVASNPMTLEHKVYDHIDFLGKDRVRVKVFEHLHRFEIFVEFCKPQAARKNLVRLDVNLKSVVSSYLERAQPLHLVAFLERFTTGQYDNYFFDHLFSHVISSMPGHLAKEYYRYWFPSEIPSLSYQSHLYNLYRGATIVLHRFVAGKYMQVKLYIDNAGNWLVELTKPDNEKFWAHQYEGKIKRILLSVWAIRSILVKSSFVVEKIKLLHQANISILFNHILDSISYIDGINFHTRPKSHRRPPKYIEVKGAGEFSKGEGQEIVLMAAIKDMHSYVKFNLNKFKHWTVNRYPNFDYSPSDTTKSIILQQVDNVMRPATWKLNVNQALDEKRSVLVYEGLWGFTHKSVSDPFLPAATIAAQQQNGNDAIDQDDDEEKLISGNHIYGTVSMKAAVDGSELMTRVELGGEDTADSADMEILQLSNERNTMIMEDKRSMKLLDLDILMEENKRKWYLRTTFKVPTNNTAIDSNINLKLSRESVRAKLMKEQIIEKELIFFTETLWLVLFKALSTSSTPENTLCTYLPHTKECPPLNFSVKVMFLPIDLQDEVMLISGSNPTAGFRDKFCWSRSSIAVNFNGTPSKNIIKQSRAFRYVTIEGQKYGTRNCVSFSSGETHIELVSMDSGSFAKLKMVIVPNFSTSAVTIEEIRQQVENEHALFITQDVVEHKLVELPVAGQFLNSMLESITRGNSSINTETQADKVLEKNENYPHSPKVSGGEESDDDDIELDGIVCKFQPVSCKSSSALYAKPVYQLPIKINKSMNRRKSTLQNAVPQAYLLYLPADEAIPYQEFRCDFNECQMQIMQLMQITSSQQFLDEISRIQMPEVIVYSANQTVKNSKSKLNTRLHRLMIEYFIPEVEDSDDTIPESKGDVILLMKRGEKDFDIIRSVLKRWGEEYLPAMLLRQQKEGREREWRINNHRLFRDKILEFSEYLLPVAEELFLKSRTNFMAHRKHSTREGGVDERKIVALLFDWFDQKRHSNRILHHFHGDDYWLDDSIHSSPEMLINFDDPIDASFTDCSMMIPSTLRFLQKLLRSKSMSNQTLNQVQTSHLLTEYKLHKCFSPGQVVYAIFQLHSHHCALAPSVCTFPGCGKIRCASRSYQISTQNRAVYSGNHPIETSIKDFLKYNRIYSTAQRRDLQLKDMLYEISTAQEDLDDEIHRDEVAQKRFDTAQLLKYKWRATVREAHDCDLLSQLLIPPEFSESGIHGMDLIAARGGLRELDMKSHLHDVHHRCKKHKALPFLKSCDIGDAIIDLQSRPTSSAGSARPKSTARSTASAVSMFLQSHLGAIPSRILKLLINRSNTDGSVDPYPALELVAKKKENIGFPMTSKLYQEIMRKLKLCSKNGVLDERNLLCPPKLEKLVDERVFSLCWDRLLQEGVVQLPDKSNVVVQVLYGCRSDLAALILKETSGVPTGGLRYVAVNSLVQLQEGVTILVYDPSSNISRAVVINQPDLERYATNLNLPLDDYNAIAQRFLLDASSLLEVERIAQYFTSLSVDLLSLQKQALLKNKSDYHLRKTQPTIQKVGYRQVISSSANLRYARMQQLLAEHK